MRPTRGIDVVTLGVLFVLAACERKGRDADPRAPAASTVTFLPPPTSQPSPVSEPPIPPNDASVRRAKAATPSELETADSAAYLNAMHDRIHPLFSGAFLAALDALPKTDMRNEATLSAWLEIILAGDGTVERESIVRASGVQAFDEGALKSITAAQPFAAPPSTTLSYDGKLYIQWQFHRDATDGCSTTMAHLILLKMPP